MAYDFESGLWKPDKDVIFECKLAPSGGSRINKRTRGPFGIRSRDGNISKDGTAYSITKIDDKETLILFQNIFSIPYKTNLLISTESNQSIEIDLLFKCWVQDLEICDREIIKDNNVVFLRDIAKLIIDDTQLRDIIRTLLTQNGDHLANEINSTGV